MKKILLSILCGLTCLNAGAQSVSTNKAFMVQTNNALAVNGLNFFVINSNLLNASVGPAGNAGLALLQGTNIWVGTNTFTAPLTSSNAFTANTNVTVFGSIVQPASGVPNLFNGGLWSDDGRGGITAVTFNAPYFAPTANTPALPGIRFGSGLGLYSPSVGQVAVATGGSQALLVSGGVTSGTFVGSGITVQNPGLNFSNSAPGGANVGFQLTSGSLLVNGPNYDFANLGTILGHNSLVYSQTNSSGTPSAFIITLTNDGTFQEGFDIEPSDLLAPLWNNLAVWTGQSNRYNFTWDTSGGLNLRTVWNNITNLPSGTTTFTADIADRKILDDPTAASCVITLPALGPFGQAQFNTWSAEAAWTHGNSAISLGTNLMAGVPRFSQLSYRVDNLGSNTGNTLTVQTADSAIFKNFGTTAVAVPNQTAFIFSTYDGTNVTVDQISIGATLAPGPSSSTLTNFTAYGTNVFTNTGGFGVTEHVSTTSGAMVLTPSGSAASDTNTLNVDASRSGYGYPFSIKSNSIPQFEIDSSGALIFPTDGVNLSIVGSGTSLQFYNGDTSRFNFGANSGSPVNGDIFCGSIIASQSLRDQGLTASLPVVTDGSQNLASMSYATFAANLGLSPDVHTNIAFPPTLSLDLGANSAVTIPGSGIGFYTTGVACDAWGYVAITNGSGTGTNSGLNKVYFTNTFAHAYTYPPAVNLIYTDRSTSFGTENLLRLNPSGMVVLSTTTYFVVYMNGLSTIAAMIAGDYGVIGYTVKGQ